MTQPVKGRRVYLSDASGLVFAPGDYGIDPRDGNWYCRPPGEDSMMGSIEKHDVVEHEDGTITVSPSILISYDGADRKWKWHGYLERGVWRQV